MLYKVENTSATDVTIWKLSTGVEWDVYGPDDAPLFSSDGQFALDHDFTDETAYHWLNSAYYSDATTLLTDFTSYGSSWRGADSAVFTDLNGTIADDEGDISASSSDYVITAGSTQYFAFYSVYNYASTFAPMTGLPHRVVTDSNAFMTVFDGDFAGILTKGIPAGSLVANWGLIPEPALPDTGSADLTGVIVGAAALASAGFALLAIRRRRAA
jgi:LPXTG-motif cell wall-anchored protein